MTANVLITGAAGFIGGSVITELAASNNSLLDRQHVFAAIRSEEQAQALSTLGVNVLRLALNDEEAVAEAVSKNNISIVIHVASSIDPGLALPLIDALSKRKEATGDKTYFIHTSALSAFYEKCGWPAGKTQDTGPIFETEKRLADSYPVRKTDVAVIEHAQARGVTSFVIVPSLIYGKGTGPWNKLSVVLPPIVQASIKRNGVNKFPENTKVSGSHVSDLTALYRKVVEKILSKETIPSDTEGYYFATAHDIYLWEASDHLAAALKARGLVTDSTTKIWANDEEAAEALGVPVAFLQALWNSGDDLVSERTRAIGWNPAWDRERFLRNIDDEVVAVLEEEKPKSSLIDSLHEAAKAH
ncbi:MAG: hypothetical protein Q9162_001641 [Coniocarpon cinnabarinum]